MNQIEKVARATNPELFAKYDVEKASGRKAANGRCWADVCCSEKIQEVMSKARAAIEAMRDPSDELLLAPGEPYRVQGVVRVPRKEGIELRREAWNKIIDAALKEGA